MLSKFKKLFRSSRSLVPIKEKEGLQQSHSDNTPSKKKEKGKRKVSATLDVGDVVETQNQCPPIEEVDIVANEFEEEREDEDKYPNTSLYVSCKFVYSFAMFSNLRYLCIINYLHVSPRFGDYFGLFNHIYINTL